MTVWHHRCPFPALPHVWRPQIRSEEERETKKQTTIHHIAKFRWRNSWKCSAFFKLKSLTPASREKVLQNRLNSVITSEDNSHEWTYSNKSHLRSRCGIISNIYGTHLATRNKAFTFDSNYQKKKQIGRGINTTIDTTTTTTKEANNSEKRSL